VDEHGIENHPDLMDPDWQRHAEREAWIDLARSRRREGRRKHLRTSAVVLVVLAAVGVAFYLWGQSASAPSPGGSESNADGHNPVSAAVPTTTAPTDLPNAAHVDLSRPFDNTPAQNWAEGIAGLTVAPPAKIGSFSAQQVGRAQDQVKQAISVAQFDPEVLQGHNPAGYAGLFAPDARADIQAHAQNYLLYLADGYHLLPVRPRMTGTMTVQPGKAGELLIHATYVVAYAFDPGTHPIYGPGDLEPFVRVDADYVVRSGSSWDPASRGLWADRISSYLTSVACGTTKDVQLKPAFSEQNYTATSLAPEPGRFDPAKPMPTEDNCRK
jgi:hypothetical protein